VFYCFLDLSQQHTGVFLCFLDSDGDILSGLLGGFGYTIGLDVADRVFNPFEVLLASSVVGIEAVVVELLGALERDF
jgi:hypothetical protein